MRSSTRRLFCALAGTAVLAQQYSIGWYQIGGGGGVSTNGPYSLAGTIGQNDAGLAMTGGNYSLTGGFWSLIAVVQTAGLPNLAITHAGRSVIISWPNTGSGTLQQNNDIAFSKRQVLPANHTPVPARLLFHHRHFLLFSHVTLACVCKRDADGSCFVVDKSGERTQIL